MEVDLHWVDGISCNFQFKSADCKFFKIDSSEF